MDAAKVTDDDAIALIANEVVMRPARVRQVLEAAVAKPLCSDMVTRWQEAKAAAEAKVEKEEKAAVAKAVREAKAEAKAAAEAKATKKE